MSVLITAEAMPAFDPVRFGADPSGQDDSTAGFRGAQAAADAVNSGEVLASTGVYRLDGGLEFPSTRVSMRGETPHGVVLNYQGDGTAIDVTATGSVRLQDFTLNNLGTGTHGIVVGSATDHTGWGYEVAGVTANDFATAGFHLANCEQSHFQRLYANACGRGFIVDASRHTAVTPVGGWNLWSRCRAANSTAEGWTVASQRASEFNLCQSLTNGGTSQVLVSGSVRGCKLLDFDVEHNGTSTGLLISGTENVVSISAYNLAKGVEFAGAAGCLLMPCSFSAVATPLTVGATCTALTIMDAGNLGTVQEAAPGQTHYVGARLRSARVEIRGSAGAGFLEFSTEQSVDPAAVADRVRLFIRDNGAGKTQLCARIGLGAVTVLGTEA